MSIGATSASDLTGAWSGDVAALPEFARRAGELLDGAPAEEILGWAVEQFAPRLAVASSMAEAVLVEMVSRIRSDVPVVFVDTGYHFAETVGTRNAVAARYQLPLISARPLQSVAEQDAEYGARLHDRDPNLCCSLRKVEPLGRTLAPYLAWATGLRRSETADRAGARAVQWDAKRGKVKINPLVEWSDADVAEYVREHDVIVNPLLSDGYDSIGCEPCTARGAGRSGRWAGLAKTECGIHL